VKWSMHLLLNCKCYSTTSHWTKQSTWPRTVLCGGWCVHMVLRTPSSACQKRRRLQNGGKAAALPWSSKAVNSFNVFSQFCECESFCFVTESSRLGDVHHRSSTFHCDSTVNVEQVQSLMSRVSASAFCQESKHCGLRDSHWLRNLVSH